MQLDYGRQSDLEMLYSDYQSDKSVGSREKIELTIDTIMRESGSSRQLRDELIRATRTGDLNHIKYCQIELRRIQAEKVNNNFQL